MHFPYLFRSFSVEVCTLRVSLLITGAVSLPSSLGEITLAGARTSLATTAYVVFSAEEAARGLGNRLLSFLRERLVEKLICGVEESIHRPRNCSPSRRSCRRSLR